MGTGTVLAEGSTMGGGGGVLTFAGFFPPHPLNTSTPRVTVRRQTDRHRLTGAVT